jgi:hypothetical protein
VFLRERFTAKHAASVVEVVEKRKHENDTINFTQAQLRQERAQG